VHYQVSREGFQLGRDTLALYARLQHDIITNLGFAAEAHKFSSSHFTQSAVECQEIRKRLGRVALCAQHRKHPRTHHHHHHSSASSTSASHESYCPPVNVGFACDTFCDSARSFVALVLHRVEAVEKYPHIIRATESLRPDAPSLACELEPDCSQQTKTLLRVRTRERLLRRALTVRPTLVCLQLDQPFLRARPLPFHLFKLTTAFSAARRFLQRRATIQTVSRAALLQNFDESLSISLFA